MCAVSMIGDHYADKWRDQYPGIGIPWQSPPLWPLTPPTAIIIRAEFDALKRDVEEMKALLKRAKEYDERNNEPDCEMEEKMDLLRKVAKLVGVNIDDVLRQKSAG